MIFQLLKNLPPSCREWNIHVKVYRLTFGIACLYVGQKLDRNTNALHTWVLNVKNTDKKISPLDYCWWLHIIFEIVLARLNLPAWPPLWLLFFFLSFTRISNRTPPYHHWRADGYFLCNSARGNSGFTEAFMENGGHKAFFHRSFVWPLPVTKCPSRIFSTLALCSFLSAIARQMPNANPYIWIV
jgi:hypothetical protein